MTIKGRVERGVIILQEGVTLPEGTEVIVSCEPGSITKPKQGKRVEFPLVAPTILAHCTRPRNESQNCWTMFLPDINFWLPLTFEVHAHHVRAKQFFDSRPAEPFSFAVSRSRGFCELLPTRRCSVKRQSHSGKVGI